MFLRAKTWSEQPLPALNHACSSRILWRMAFLIRLRITRQNTLLLKHLGIDNKVIPRVLSQTEISIFFGIFTIKPFLQSSGILRVPTIHFKRGKGLQQMLARQPWLRVNCFNAGCLAIFKDLMVSFSSLTVGVPTLIPRSLEAGWDVTVFRGQGWFRTIFKCSTYLAAYSRTLLSMRPSRSLTTVQNFWFVPQSLRVILWSAPISRFWQSLLLP